jgi:transposase
MLYAGIDIHRKKTEIAVLDAQARQVLSRRVNSQPGEVLGALQGLGPLEGPLEIEVAFESTYGYGWLADALLEAGIPAHMAHPLATKAISSAKVKNDRVDARMLAQLLRAKLLPEAWLAPAEAREARLLVRTRALLARMRARLKNQVHALLADRAIQAQESDLFGAGGRRRLAELRLPQMAQHRVEANLRLIDRLGPELEAADRLIKQRFWGDPRVRRLLPIPGIGLYTAATLTAEIWDISRFPNARKLCSWAGLTPTERSSGEHTRRGHISKQGSRWVRWVLVEAAANPAMRSPQLRELFLRASRGKHERAVLAQVAVARRLLQLCYYALRDEGGCRAHPVGR